MKEITTRGWFWQHATNDIKGVSFDPSNPEPRIFVTDEWLEKYDEEGPYVGKHMKFNEGHMGLDRDYIYVFKRYNTERCGWELEWPD